MLKTIRKPVKGGYEISHGKRTVFIGCQHRLIGRSVLVDTPGKWSILALWTHDLDVYDLPSEGMAVQEAEHWLYWASMYSDGARPDQP